MNNLLLAAFGGQQIIMIVLVVILFGAMIVLPMFTNKKRKKQVEELHNSIMVGDTIKTVGGIVGKVVAINQINALEKEFVLETGLEGSKSTMVFDFNAVYQVMNRVPRPVPVAPVVEQPATEATSQAAITEETAKVEEQAAADDENK